jgi:hypothetical protein
VWDGTESKYSCFYPAVKLNSDNPKLMAAMAHGDAAEETVMPRHPVSPSASPMTGASGVSSPLQLLVQTMLSLEYWIARYRGRRRETFRALS